MLDALLEVEIVEPGALALRDQAPGGVELDEVRALDVTREVECAPPARHGQEPDGPHDGAEHQRESPPRSGPAAERGEHTRRRNRAGGRRRLAERDHEAGPDGAASRGKAGHAAQPVWGSSVIRRSATGR